jgi:hypothetical protein
MRETKQALQAFEDYQSMGSDRSLSALLARYQEVTDPPTRSLRTLEKWSANLDWPDRIETASLDQRQAEFDEGLSLAFERVRALKGLAASVGAQLTSLLAEGGRADEFAKLAGVYRGFLEDIAAETGGRVKRVSIKKELRDFAIDLARSQGYEDSVAIEIADLVAAGG